MTKYPTQPGHNLDAVIAETIFHWEWWRSSFLGARCLFAPGAIPRCPDEWFNERADGTERLVGDWDRVKIPKYSTKIKPAMKIIDALRNSQQWCCIKIDSDYSYIWTVTLTRSGIEGEKHEPEITVEHESLPFAICMAGLAAAGLDIYKERPNKE